jgi:LDH2 family malate/lactate/ureidoglycolate dehydrogenase
MPLGGSEITSGYKGYGLGLLVETFCGVLAGEVGCRGKKTAASIKMKVLGM